MSLEAALRKIIKVRDDIANGEKPPFSSDQSFDDWAADLADSAINNREVFEAVSLSTAHISWEDSETLKDLSVTEYAPIRVMYDQHGFYVTIPALEEKFDEQVKRSVLSKDFWNLLLVLKEEGYHSLILDCDAPIYENLKQFDW